MSAGNALDDDTVAIANLRQPVSTRKHLGLAGLRLVNDFEAVASAAATLPREKDRPIGGFLGSVAGDTALTYGLRGDIQSQNRDFLLNSDFAARHLNEKPNRAALECIPVRLVEYGLLGLVDAVHRYPD